jgi:TatD DNase family protein
MEKQRQAFLLQLELADELDLPVVIHCRDAHHEMREILKNFTAQDRLRRRGVIHCFTGLFEDARTYHELGFLVSLTGIVTFAPRGLPGGMTPLQRVVKDMPLSWMMLETDAPYLAPEPYRGQRNEPWMMEETMKKVAQLKGVTREEVERVTTRNAEELFRLPGALV